MEAGTALVIPGTHVDNLTWSLPYIMKQPKCWFMYRPIDLTDMKNNHVPLHEPMSVGTIEEMLTYIHWITTCVRYIHTVSLDWAPIVVTKGTVSMALVILPPALVILPPAYVWSFSISSIRSGDTIPLYMVKLRSNTKCVYFTLLSLCNIHTTCYSVQPVGDSFAQYDGAVCLNFPHKPATVPLSCSLCWQLLEASEIQVLTIPLTCASVAVWVQKLWLVV